MTLPITPEDIKSKLTWIPDHVLREFNKLILERYDGTCSKFTEQDVLNTLCTSTDRAFREKYFKEIARNGWLNCEYVYGLSGWRVVHHSGKYEFHEDVRAGIRV